MRIEQVTIPLVRAAVGSPRISGLLDRFDRWGNPFCDDVYRDPYPGFALIRADGPVVYRSLYQQWFVTGYDEARQVLSSEAFGVAGQIETLLAVRPYSRLTPSSKRFVRNWLLFQDPPDHTRMRRLVTRAFTPRRIAELEPRVEAIAVDLLSELADEREPDVFEGFTAQLPINVIADLIGVPKQRWDWSRSVTTEIARLLDPFQPFDPDLMDDVINELGQYYSGLAGERRVDPRDDLLTALAQVEDEGDGLTHEELIAMLAFIMSAGHETTTGLLGNAILALAAHPDQRRLIRDTPELWPNAVEELCRFDTSVKNDPWVALEDVEVGSVTIPKGSNVLVMLGAVNRDPRQWDEPDELRLDRRDPKPLSFGHGIHHCLGAALARLELRVGLHAFLETFGDYEIDPDAVRWKQSATLRNQTHLPVRRARDAHL